MTRPRDHGCASQSLDAPQPATSSVTFTLSPPTDSSQADQGPAACHHLAQACLSAAVSHPTSPEDSGAVCEVSVALLSHAAKVNGHKPRAGQKMAHFLARLTHVHLNDRQLEGTMSSSISDTCPAAGVIYLYNNRLSDVSALAALTSLTMLYLQDNALADMASLRGLTALQKLYLDGNAIQRVEALSKLSRLEELHVSRQKLPEGLALSFDAATMRALSGNLITLRAAQSRVETTEALAGMQRLTSLDLSGNSLVTAEALEGALLCQCIEDLDLRGNEVMRAPKMHDQIVIQMDNLRVLNDRAVTHQEREFLLRLQIKRLKDEERRSVASLGGSDLLHASSAPKSPDGSAACEHTHAPPATAPSGRRFGDHSIKVVAGRVVGGAFPPQGVLKNPQRGSSGGADWGNSVPSSASTRIPLSGSRLAGN